MVFLPVESKGEIIMAVEPETIVIKITKKIINIITNKNNELQYHTLQLIPTTLNDGSKGLTIIAKEITEQKKAEKALKESEERFKTI